MSRKNTQGAPQTPAEQLEAAIARALESRLVVIAEGRIVRSNAPVYFVPSQSNPEQWHRIIQTGQRLACDCFAAQYGVLCAHRAAVHLHLKARAALRQRPGA